METNALIEYSLHLADTALILGQRNAEWCGHGPILEQDIAITNISLDLIGQARYFYQYAAELINQSATSAKEATENTLAYLRTEREYKNLLLVEQPNGDWGQTVIRQFLFSSYQHLLFDQLQKSRNENLASIAAKSLKEITYHLRWSSEWVIRLGDGTDESHQRMTHAIKELWPYTGEMFLDAPYEKETGVDIKIIKQLWNEKVSAVLNEATLRVPEKAFMHSGGKTGKHTEHLGYILTELQYMQRAYPDSQW
ncbi:MAG TPA: phenylacetate-CoA oxygenase subunit PaaC [Chitinophagaceae bacterium]|nr:phenylacetate-CoA oxygenase subunit PaaC [Chitinophagaceae bacterium]